jgi:hypothetical protein
LALRKFSAPRQFKILVVKLRESQIRITDYAPKIYIVAIHGLFGTASSTSSAVVSCLFFCQTPRFKTAHGVKLLFLCSHKEWREVKLKK